MTSQLPTLNALLNATAFVLLMLGWRAIRVGDRERHRTMMVAATSVSAAFLVSYLVYHFEVGSVKFTATGWIRPVYFFVLITHIVLAAVIVPLVLKTLYHALKEQLDRHRRWARWTWPIWMYVSVTGVVVYLMLYHWTPGG